MLRISVLPLALLASTTVAVGTGTAAGAQTAPAASSAGSAPAAQAPQARILGIRAGGYAWGSRLTGNELASAGKTSLSHMCTRQFPKTNRNEVAATQEALRSIADLEVIASQNRSHRLPNGRPAVTSTTTIAGGELVGGLVSFDAIRSFSRVIKTPNGFRRISRGRVVGLKVSGLPISIPTDNSTKKIEIPLVGGEVAVNVKGGRSAGNSARAHNLGLRVKLPAGAGTLRLARSSARLDTGRVPIFGGGAWGTEVPTVLGLVESGRTGYQPVTCRGTDGELRTNNTADVSVPGVLGVGATTSDTRTRLLRRGRASAMGRSSVTDVSLGGGAVQVDAITSRAFAYKRSNGTVRKARRSEVLGLTVGGKEITLPADGSSVTVDGIAKIESRATSWGKRGVKVVALRVTLLSALDKPVQVDLGVAGAYVHR